MPSDTIVEFAVGEVVCLRSDTGISGVVMKVLPGSPENRYQVFLDNKPSFYYASQLQRSVPQDTASDILPLSMFQAHLCALQIRHPSLSTLYSLHAARVNFIPYQFRPVLKFIHSDRPRLLIADEVGVGKTIEAGLILRELQARREINSVLVICPRSLVKEHKWQKELKRFDEEFEELDGGKLRSCLNELDLDGEWPRNRRKCIVPFSVFDERLVFGKEGRRSRSREGLVNLDTPPHFDLVIVDEAHHLRNSNTYLHQGVKFFCDHADAVVLLTATPIQLGDNDLYTLLHLLRPDLILDSTSYQSMSAPNPHINRAVERARGGAEDWQANCLADLQQAGLTEWGQRLLSGLPEFQGACQQLSGVALNAEERIACIRAMENLHTFSRLINRTRRRDIGNFTTRKAETVTVNFTPAQEQLHNALLAVQARILRRAHKVEMAQAVQFMMTTLRRQAASCLYALAPLIEQILTRRFDPANADAWDTADEDASDTGGMESIAPDALVSLQAEIANVLQMARDLDPFDPKLQAFLSLVRDKQELANRKILVFSTFRHTLNYLVTHLLRANIRVGLVHGGISDEERSDLRKRFELEANDSRAIDVLLSSEVGCEGLDYQFCDCLINYDLPWNPMRVEQRIGRIDRYGQKSETVSIHNLVTPGTVDFDIYERCLWRIGVFQQALGGSEEILGRLTRELKAVAENLELTEEERQERLQQLADNEIRLVQEQAALEEQQAELFGNALPLKQFEQDVKDATSAWLSPFALQNLIEHYLSEICGGEGHILGAKALKTLRLNQDARNRLLQDYSKLPPAKSSTRRDWELWLKGDEPHLAITFEPACAGDNRATMFITPVHPLAQQAARLFTDVPPFRTACRVTDEDIPPGTYPFAIYQWQKRGLRDDVEFQPVCANKLLNERFLSLLETAQTAEVSPSDFPAATEFDALDQQHYPLWSQARAKHQELTRRIVEQRGESLRASHRARIAQLQYQRDSVTEEKIRVMRSSEIRAAAADFDRRIAEINAAEGRADLTATQVAIGILIVEAKQ